MGMEHDIELKLKAEIESFKGLWNQGYYEGDTLDPLASSTYDHLGYMSVLYATYLVCIKPYITNQSTVLEIGPGRGTWTKTFLKAKEVWCLDALSAEHNNFWNYLNHPSNVQYFQVSDFSCNMLPENKFDYFFSFGCFCHISFEGITKYMENLYPKMKRGAQCFVMIADYDKYNKALDNIQELSVYRILPPKIRRLYLFYRSLRGRDNIYKNLDYVSKNEDTQPSPGRWYHAGIEKTCLMMERIGYKIIDPDVGVNYRDPVIHFSKE